MVKEKYFAVYTEEIEARGENPVCIVAKSLKDASKKARKKIELVTEGITGIYKIKKNKCRSWM